MTRDRVSFKAIFLALECYLFCFVRFASAENVAHQKASNSPSKGIEEGENGSSGSSHTAGSAGRIGSYVVKVYAPGAPVPSSSKNPVYTGHVYSGYRSSYQKDGASSSDFGNTSVSLKVAREGSSGSVTNEHSDTVHADSPISFGSARSPHLLDIESPIRTMGSSSVGNASSNAGTVDAPVLLDSEQMEVSLHNSLYSGDEASTSKGLGGPRSDDSRFNTGEEGISIKASSSPASQSSFGPGVELGSATDNGLVPNPEAEEDDPSSKDKVTAYLSGDSAAEILDEVVESSLGPALVDGSSSSREKDINFKALDKAYNLETGQFDNGGDSDLSDRMNEEPLGEENSQPAPDAEDEPDESFFQDVQYEQLDQVGIQILDKINGEVKTFAVRAAETLAFKRIRVNVAKCFKTKSLDGIEYVGFVEILEIKDDSSVEKIYSGWMFSEHSLNVLEHPIYDVRVTEPQMDEGLRN